MASDADRRRFERLVVPHLSAAYNLARWLTGNDQDARDVVQEAMLRALHYFGSFRGEQARPWLLQVVRRTCYGWLQHNRSALLVTLDEDDDDGAGLALSAPAADEPHAVALRNADRVRINAALAALPIPFREVLVLRDMEDLSYKDIARIADLPIGTVMSRLSRARAAMRDALAPTTRPLLRAVNSGGRR